ncbi:hypothetical protein HAX54_052547, partial [Datura stramonium]|nr:hypothetical protein [Datura stramonium]
MGDKGEGALRQKQDSDEVETCSNKDLVIFDRGINTLLQTTNKFLDLEDDTQLTEVPQTQNNAKIVAKINANGVVNQSDIGGGIAPGNAMGLNVNAKVLSPAKHKKMLGKETSPKEVVASAFKNGGGGALVPTNQSCQEIPSQTLATDVDSDTDARKLWGEQAHITKSGGKQTLKNNNKSVQIHNGASNIVVAQGANLGDEVKEITGIDHDDESIAQNFQNATWEGDLPPRQIERGKSSGKQRRKHREGNIPIS